MYAEIVGALGEKVPDIRTFSPLPLAYLGDGIYELVIRSYLTAKGNRPVKALHKAAEDYVKAPTQARMAGLLLPELTEEERGVYQRGRNASPSSVAKNAKLSDYHMATGLEALFGYLYMKGQMDRVLELVGKFMEMETGEDGLK
jgi:ribonuclease-3 family protein